MTASRVRHLPVSCVVRARPTVAALVVADDLFVRLDALVARGGVDLLCPECSRREFVEDAPASGRVLVRLVRRGNP